MFEKLLNEIFSPIQTVRCADWSTQDSLENLGIPFETVCSDHCGCDECDIESEYGFF